MKTFKRLSFEVKYQLTLEYNIVSKVDYVIMCRRLYNKAGQRFLKKGK